MPCFSHRAALMFKLVSLKKRGFKNEGQPPENGRRISARPIPISARPIPARGRRRCRVVRICWRACRSRTHDRLVPWRSIHHDLASPMATPGCHASSASAIFFPLARVRQPQSTTTQRRINAWTRAPVAHLDRTQVRCLRVRTPMAPAWGPDGLHLCVSRYARDGARARVRAGAGSCKGG